MTASTAFYFARPRPEERRCALPTGKPLTRGMTETGVHMYQLISSVFRPQLPEPRIDQADGARARAGQLTQHVQTSLKMTSRPRYCISPTTQARLGVFDGSAGGISPRANVAASQSEGYKRIKLVAGEFNLIPDPRCQQKHRKSRAEQSRAEAAGVHVSGCVCLPGL